MSKVTETFTSMMIARIEARRAAGEDVVAPWRKTWDPKLGMPRNLVTGKPYRGGNIWMTLCQGYASPFWLTRKQIKKLGGTIRKLDDGSTVKLKNGTEIPASEPYTPIIFWWFPTAEQKAEGRFAFMKFYQVWNTEQVDGIEEAVAAAMPELSGDPVNPIEEAQALVDGWHGAPELHTGGGKCAYNPASDKVAMPPMNTFEDAEAYYRALYHELGHATGHRNRLARDGVCNPIRFGSHDYSEEELVAEMAASMLAGFAGIGSEEADENSAAYLDHWLKVLKAEPDMLAHAGGAAQKAVDLIRGISWEKADK
jgi:antirestriction protein ArdC